MKTLVLGFIFSILSIAVIGQVPKVLVEKSNVLIGEQFYIYYRLPIKTSDSVIYSPLKTSIPSYILEGEKDTSFINVDIIIPFKDSIFQSGKLIEWVGKYKVSIWDSGKVVLPELYLKINDSVFNFQSITINVSLSKHIEGKDIYDIKEGFTELPDSLKGIKSFLSNYWIWILLILFVIGLVMYLIIIKRKKDQLATILSLEEIAIHKIGELNKKKLWIDKKLKEHYIELSYILRDYLSNKLEISLLEKTTVEANLLLKEKALPIDKIELISEILQKSDMVKFAKSAPEEYEILKNSELTIQIIESVQKLNS